VAHFGFAFVLLARGSRIKALILSLESGRQDYPACDGLCKFALRLGVALARAVEPGFSSCH
jgi:hypothetical protein